MIARRTFLVSLAGASITAVGPGHAATDDAAYVATATRDDGTGVLLGFDAAGDVHVRAPLPVPAHAGAVHPSRAEAIVFARQPGNFAMVTDLSTEQMIAELAPPDGCQLNGHGVYADGGATLLTVEQMVQGGAGLIGLWDVASGYTRIGKIPTHGLGPRDLRLMPDGRSVVVANSGVMSGDASESRPEMPDMAPSLAYVSLAGELLEETRLEPALQWNAIHHLALRGDGLVAFAMNWRGNPGLGHPLLGLHRRGTPAVLVEAPRAHALAMKDHAGAAAFSGDGSEIAVTSSRGGRILRFTADGTFVGADILNGVAGVAPHPAGFIATEADGGIVTLGREGVQMLSEHDLSWDAHILAV